MTKAVTIRGVTYPSQRAAADALGVKPQTVCSAIKRGYTDKIGRGPMHKGCEPVKVYPVTLGGTHYPSQKAAADALGVPEGYISGYLKVLEAINKKGH